MSKASGIAKLKLFIELKENLNKGLNKANERIKKATGKMQSKLNDFKAGSIEVFDSISSRIPGFSSSLKLLANPYTIIATVALLAAVNIGKATQKAIEFEHTFMNIRQLNLDKSRDELDKYRTKIAEAAFDTGINLQKMTTGYYDLQSGLGKYGNEATSISKQIARYSLSTQADYNDSVNQTIKSMKAFGLQTEDVRSLLESNAKTVQVGIVTYADFAKVQTEYAGAAAAAGQNVDTANKIFAAFTSISKNANVAATKTKTAFEGLSDPKVLNSLQKYGVKVYDNTGKMRQLDKVIQDTSKKIDAMNDQQFHNFMGSVGGPEGLRDLFSKLRNGSKDFFKTLESYDKSSVNLDKMYKNALNDPKTAINMVKEKFNTAFTQMGTHFMGFVGKIAQGIILVMDYFKKVYQQSKLLQDIVYLIGGAFKWAFKIVIAPIKIVINIIKTLWKLITNVSNGIGGWIEKVTGIKVSFKSMYDNLRPYLIWVKEFLTDIADIMYDVFTFNVFDAKDKIKNFKMPDLKEIKQKIKIETIQNSNDDAELESDDDGIIKNADESNQSTTSDVKTISNNSQSKNITINIDSFIKNFTPTHQSINSMNKDELEQWLVEIFMRVIRSAETSM